MPNKGNKWSLLQYWKRANWGKRIKWLVAVASLVGSSGLLTFYQRSHQFSIEHRPRIVFARPPQLVGQISCDVSENEAISLEVGGMEISLRNGGNGDAPKAFVQQSWKFVPDPSSRYSSYDALPSVTDQTCTTDIAATVGTFPLNAREETTIGIGPHNSIQADARGPAKGIVLGHVKPADRPNNKTTFQIYAGPTCVYYFDEEGKRHGTCMTYRLSRKGQYRFACGESPISGELQQMSWGFCED